MAHQHGKVKVARKGNPHRIKKSKKGARGY